MFQRIDLAAQADGAPFSSVPFLVPDHKPFLKGRYQFARIDPFFSQCRIGNLETKFPEQAHAFFIFQQGFYPCNADPPRIHLTAQMVQIIPGLLLCIRIGSPGQRANSGKDPVPVLIDILPRFASLILQRLNKPFLTLQNLIQLFLTEKRLYARQFHFLFGESMFRFHQLQLSFFALQLHGSRLVLRLLGLYLQLGGLTLKLQTGTIFLRGETELLRRTVQRGLRLCDVRLLHACQFFIGPE